MAPYTTSCGHLSQVNTPFSLIMFYDKKDIIIGDYSYTTKSENHLINKLHVDSEVLKKFASLKVEKYCSKSEFVSAVGKAYGEDLNSEFLRIIVAAAEKKWRLNLTRKERYLCLYKEQGRTRCLCLIISKGLREIDSETSIETCHCTHVSFVYILRH